MSHLEVGDLQVQLVRRLQEHKGVEVWEGEARNRPVLVKKVAHSCSSSVLILLRHEARVLAELRSPLFAQLLAFEQSDDATVIVSALLEGVPVSDKTLTLTDALQVGVGCLEALEELHGRDILHGDLKPEHLLWNGHKVALCDFGLARRLRAEEAEGPAGATVAYAAPETLGLLNHPVGPPSDLYSVGAVLRQLLGPDQAPADPLRDKLTPPTLILGLPLQVTQFLAHLSHPDPEKRYQSAHAARLDLQKIVQSVQQGSAETPLPLGTADLRASLVEPTLVGRQDELQTLEQRLQESSDTVWLAAPSGRGKTHLLSVLADQQRLQGRTVLWVRAVAPRAGARLPLWQELGHQLGRWLGSDEAARTRLVEGLNEVEQRRLRQAFPSWGFLPSAANVARTPQETILETLAKALEGLGSSVILLYDDVQWADPFTLRLLSRTVSGPGTVAAYRTEEVGADLARVVRGKPVMKLPTLGDEASHSLLTTMGGPLPEEVWKPLLQKAEGEPLLLQSLLRGAVETEALRRDGAGWAWTNSAPLQVDRRASHLISDRLQAVPPATRNLLATGAVLGKQFSLSLACQLSDEPPDSLEHALSRHLVWRGERAATFTHDKIREALLEGQSAEEQASIHARAAAILEAEGGASAQDLALHWSAAGQEEKALAHAVDGARESLARFDYPTAQALWRIADGALGPEHPVELRRDVYAGQARTALLAGDNGLAASLFPRALELEWRAMPRAELLADYLAVRSKNCEFSEIRDLSSEGLGLLGVKVPSGKTLAAAAGARELAMLIRQLGKPRPATSSPEDKIIGKLLVALAEASVRTVDPPRLLWSGTLACRKLYALDSPAEGAIAFGFASMFLGGLGMLGQREKLNALGRQQAEIYPQVGGQVMGMSGVTPLQDGDLPLALSRFTDAIPLCIAYGDRWNEQVCGLHRAYTLMTMGRFEEARPELRRLVFTEQTTDPSIPLVCAAFLCETGMYDDLEAWAETHLGSFQTSIFQVVAFQLQGFFAARRRDWPEAIEQMEKAARISTAITSFYSGSSGAWLATFCRLAATDLPPEATSQLRGLTEKARLGLARGKKVTKHWPNLHSHLIREEAIQAALIGDWKSARRLFSKSLNLSDSLGQAFQSAWTLYERGRFAEAAGWKDWLGDTAIGLAAARRLGGAIPGVARDEAPSRGSLARLERFQGVLESGRRLVALEGDVLETLRVEAETLLRSDRVSVTAPGEPLPEGWSETLHARCLREGCAVTEGVVEDPSRSLLLQDARSLLMAPVKVDDDVVAVLACWQKTVGGFFGEEETRLADYLCTLAGAGLENARLLGERARTFSALAASEERFRGFFAHSGVGTALLDERGVVVEENPYLITLLSGSSLEKTPWQMAHAGDRDALRLGFAGLAETGRTRHDVELRLHRAGGEVVWTQSCLVKLPVREEEETRYLLTVADITHRRIEEMLNFLEGERRGLSAEIHDELAQGLTALKLTLAQAQGTQPELLQAQDLAQLLVEKASSLIGSLRNPIAEGVDLVSALKGLVSHFSIETEIDIEVAWPQEPLPTSDLVALVLYRVVQEGLANIRQHSGATQVTMSLEQHEDRLELCLQDNGKGFDPNAWLNRRHPESHFGLLAMRDRVEMIGGQLHLESPVGNGTTLTACLKR